LTHPFSAEIAENPEKMAKKRAEIAEILKKTPQNCAEITENVSFFKKNHIYMKNLLFFLIFF
jgi:hypothetical protein